MKWSTVILVGCVTLGAALPITAQWVEAQGTAPSQVEPQQNDRRPAIARVNPKKPIQIRVVSQTNVPVVASTIAANGDRVVAPGKTVMFGRLHTSYLPLPLDLQITLQDTPDPEKPLRIFLNVQTAGNEVIVNVRTGFTGVGNSSQAISIDETGAIYVF